MAEDINIAKRELYTDLRSRFPGIVTGAGIQEKKGSEVIVIFLTKALPNVLSLIPNAYKGNKLVTQIQSIARAM